MYQKLFIVLQTVYGLTYLKGILFETFIYLVKFLITRNILSCNLIFRKKKSKLKVI